MNITPLEKWIAEKTGLYGQLNTESLRDYQLEKLRETLFLCQSHSRFYRERFTGVSPEKITTMADVSRLPFTTPKDLTENSMGLLCVSPQDIGRIVTLSTSGTTGKPKRVFFTDDDQELTKDFFHHGMTTLTDATDRVMIFMPGTTAGSVGDLLTKGLARFGCFSVVYGPIKDYNDALKALFEQEITCVVGIPSQILALSRTRLSGPLSRQPAIKSVLLSADYVPKAAAAFLRQSWGATVYSHYGMTEMGLGGGVECSALSGYHMRDADLLFEVIDPASGRPVPDGEYGEVVFSTLTRRGMPLLRYRTGDRSRFLLGRCNCGTFLRRLDHVTGRIREAVRLSGGHTLSIAELDELVLPNGTVEAYSAELVTTSSGDCLRITVRSCDQSFDASQLTLSIQHALADLFGQDILTIEVFEGDIGYFTTGTSKRLIADRREH